MIRCQDVSKKFDGFEALKNVSFEVKEGEIFGLVGPNGAGKTTCARILSGIMKQDSGSVTIGKFDISKDSLEARKVIGYLPEEPHLYEELTALEILNFFADIYEIPNEMREKRFKKLLSLVGLTERKNDKISVFSKGMRHRLALARSLINEPSILILDEPTMGLDPATAIQIREFILSMKGAGKTIFLCTHYMDEADMLCDRIAIIVGGRIVRSGTPEYLKKSVSKERVIEIIPKNMSKKTLDSIKKIGKKVEVKGRKVLVTLKKKSDELTLLKKIKPLSFRTVEPTLDEVFVQTIAEQHESS
jgi:ABC-2 type transport system ATP-binding protein